MIEVNNSVSDSLVDIVQYTREQLNKYTVSPDWWKTKQTLEALMILKEVLKEIKE